MALVGALAACSGDDPDEALAGYGLPTQSAGATTTAPRTTIEGVLRVASNGCFDLELPDGREPWVIWPDGAAQDDVHVLLGNDSWTDGDALVGVGAVVPADALEDWSSTDGYIHSFGDFCEAGERGVVVLDTVASAD